MLDLGKHAVFIWASYGVVACALAGLVLWVWLDGNRQKRDLADLERQGIRRRSESKD